MKKRLIFIITAVFLTVCAVGFGGYHYLYQDFTGRPWAEIAAYQEANPYVHISYTVTIDDSLQLDQDSSHVTIDSLTQADSLLAQADYLQQLHTIDLGSAALTGEQLKALHLAFPNTGITAHYMDVLGTVYPKDAAELDLSAMTPEQIPTVLTDLTFLTKVQTVNLMPADGPALLDFEAVARLLEALPDITFTYRFDFYGQVIDLNQERVEYISVQMGDEAEAELREILSLIPNCCYFKLDRCGFSSPVLDAVNRDFPDTKVVWRVFYGNSFNALTDETVIRSSHHLRDHNVSEMKYLTDVVYMDIGHNEYLTDISFLTYMPNLKLLILSGGLMNDLSPLSGNTNLEFLELCFMSRIEDLSPLASCTGLKYLNVGGTRTNSLAGIMDLPLERFVCLEAARIPQADKDAFIAAHPDCLVVTEGKQPYGYGWRYEDDGLTFNEYYATMRQIFHYDDENLLNGYRWDAVTANDPW